MAQLVARLVRNEKVGGSNPPSSTTGRHPIADVGFCMPGRVRAVPVVVLIGAAGVRGACWAGLWGRAAVCAGGRRPGREPSAPRASLGASPRSPARPRRRPRAPQPGALAPSGVLHTGGALGYRTKRVGFMVTFRLFGAEKSVLKLVGANLKDGLNVLVL